MANYLPATYQPNWGYSGVGQQVYPQYAQPTQQPMSAAQQTQQVNPGLIWVDGEVGAKAYQMPSGWPSNQPIALWDTNDTVIYLKSTNPMGMPNPLQKARYVLEEYKQTGVGKTAIASGDAQDMSEYVKKDDMERMKHELMEAINGVNTSGTAAKRTVKGET